MSTGGMVATFLIAFLQTAGFLALFSVPLLVVSRRKGRNRLARQYLIAIGVIALVSGILASNSEQLVAQCVEAGGIECLDYGSVGLNVVIAVGYIIVAWVKTMILFRE